MIYVMSDIHGNLERFNSVMSQINLQPEDTLYILGDVVDRFPDGIRILRRLMLMPNVKMLIGNHEYMMLNALSEPIDNMSSIAVDYDYNMALWYGNGGYVTHRYLKRINKTLRKEIFDYLLSLPLNYDIDVNGMKYKLAHAAPIDLYDEFGRGYRDEREFTVWYRFHSCEELPDDYTLVYGHTPTLYVQDVDPTEIWYGQNRICIDCGAGYDSDLRCHTRLACLRLDDYKEFYSNT